MTTPILETRCLQVFTGKKPILHPLDVVFPANRLTAVIGPSGVGKSTLLRCLNRLIEFSPNLRRTGEVLFHGISVYDPKVNGDELRARIGIIFQQPVAFPRSIQANVLFGIRHLGTVPRAEWPALAERALREATLWDEVKDRLREPAQRLSVGQQQRLCLARTLAVNPEVILLDEPTSALDPKAAFAIEELLLQLKAQRTLVLITHSYEQAARVADDAICLAVRDGAGELADSGCCHDVLKRQEPSMPPCPRAIAIY